MSSCAPPVALSVFFAMGTTDSIMGGGAEYAVGLPVTLHNGVDNGRDGWIQIGGIQARDNTYDTVLVLSWGDKKNDSAGIAGRTDG